MEREILFRGIDIKPGKWVEGWLIYNHIAIPVDMENGDSFDSFKDTYFFHKVIQETVGQFTGMTDKNGTKIFEGDIIRESYKGHERIYHVFWDDDYSAFRAKCEDITFYLDEIVESHCEVIGNIHDNK